MSDLFVKCLIFLHHTKLGSSSSILSSDVWAYFMLHSLRWTV